MSHVRIPSPRTNVHPWHRAVSQIRHSFTLSNVCSLLLLSISENCAPRAIRGGTCVCRSCISWPSKHVGKFALLFKVCFLISLAGFSINLAFSFCRLLKTNLQKMYIKLDFDLFLCGLNRKMNIHQLVGKIIIFTCVLSIDYCDDIFVLIS